VIAHWTVGAVVLDNEEIERGDAAVFGEAGTGTADHAGPRAADVMLLLPADPHHDRRARLLREQRRNHHRDGAGALAAEPAAAVFADQHDVRGVDSEPARQRIDRPRDTLRRTVKEQLAVLPVGHGAACFHRLVAGGLDDERLVDDDGGRREAGVEIAVRPLFRRLARRQRAFGRGREILIGPLQRLDFRARRRRAAAAAGRRRDRKPDVPVGARVRAGRPQALDRIDDERQRLEVDFDFLDRFGSRTFVDGGDRQDRLALIQRLVGERFFGAAKVRHLVGRENRLYARHRERRARVDPPYARMRHRAEQQFREQHAVGAVVLGVFGAPGHLRNQIGRRVVLANKFRIRHEWLPSLEPYCFFRVSVVSAAAFSSQRAPLRMSRRP
jgi:hypothetical protein